MTDNLIDGIGQELPDEYTDIDLTNLIAGAPIAHLTIPNASIDGEPVTVDDLENLLKVEAASTLNDSDFDPSVYDDAKYAPTPIGDDFDIDGWPDITDPDDDNDGADDDNDAFPMDPSETADSDSDGVGDNADAFPNDSNCSTEEQGVGDHCFVSLVSTHTIGQIKTMSNGDLYFYIPDLAAIIQFDSGSNSFIRMFNTDPELADEHELRDFIFVESHDRMYMSFINDTDSAESFVGYIDINNDAKITEFATFSYYQNNYGALSSAGNYLTIAHERDYIYDINGDITDDIDEYYNSLTYKWHGPLNRLYRLVGNSEKAKLTYHSISQHSGEIGSSEGSDYIDGLAGKITVSPDNTYISVSSGQIFDAETLVIKGSIESYQQAVWTNDGLITLRTIGSFTQLTRYDANLRLIDQQSFSGISKAIAPLTSASYTIITNADNATIFGDYTAVDDSDSDGVNNDEDAYPIDPSASIDADNDGYPDAWHEGHSEDTSTTGLILDAFVDNAWCWLAEHADENDNCDYSVTMPEFTTDNIFVMNNIVYLYNSNNNVLYRYDVSVNNYIEPYKMPDSIILNLALVPNHQRIYFSSNNDKIGYISLADGTIERKFAELDNYYDQVKSITAVGNFVIIVDKYGSDTHYIFDVDGNLTYKEDHYINAASQVFNPTNSKIYLIRNNDNYLYYMLINQETGVVDDSGYKYYSYNVDIHEQLYIANSGKHLLSGNGYLFDTESLEITNKESLDIADAAMYENLFVANDDEGTVRLYQIYNNINQLHQYDINDVTHLFTIDDTVLAISQSDGAFSYQQIVFGDRDNDGLPGWWESLYGLNNNDASDASSDTDEDGLTALQEYEHHSDPLIFDTDGDKLNDGEEVLTYSTDPSQADTDKDSLNDYEEVITYATDPNKADTDGDGFNDGVEIEVYGTDPNDAGSIPSNLSTYTNSFESDTLDAAWSSEDWYFDNSEAQDGEQSIRSGDIGDNESSTLSLNALFNKGTLYFYGLVASESCCDRLRVYLNGNYMFRLTSSNWTEYSITINKGEHTIDFIYEKDSWGSYGKDAAWIDNVRFTPE